jgi:MerR family transcriptional regulator, light-induced transcriptional regulator
MNTAAAVVDHQALAERFLRALLDGDRRRAMHIAIEEGVHAGARVVDIQARVVAAAQDELGRLWQQNRITIAQEHLATGISHLVLARLLDQGPAIRRNGVRVAVACVEGELHDLPARLVADFLDGAGFNVQFFGASVPTDHLVRSLAAATPALLALSTTMTFNIPSLRLAITRIRAAFPVLPIVIGGHATRWSGELAGQLGVSTAPATPDELVAAIRELTGIT